MDNLEQREIDGMAKHNNNITFNKAQIDTSDPENILITEVFKEHTETHSLTAWLKSYEGDNRFVNLSIKEVTEISPIEMNEGD